MRNRGKRDMLQVFVAPGAKGEAHALAAIRELNKAAGMRIATLVYHRESADVVIRKGNPRGDYGGYYAPRGRRKDVITLDRNLYGPQEGYSVKPEYKKNLTEHEIGHALGLDHKAGRHNLMNPDIVGTNLSKAQRRQLRETFREGGYRQPSHHRDGEGGGEVERRSVVMDFGFTEARPVIGMPNMGTMPQWFVEAVRRELIRSGSRNPDIFGGRA